MLERFLNVMNFYVLCDWMICIIYEWWKLYENDVIHYNVWVVVWWYFKYEIAMFNKDPLASLMI